MPRLEHHLMTSGGFPRNPSFESVRFNESWIKIVGEEDSLLAIQSEFLQIWVSSRRWIAKKSFGQLNHIESFITHQTRNQAKRWINWLFTCNPLKTMLNLYRLQKMCKKYHDISRFFVPSNIMESWIFKWLNEVVYIWVQWYSLSSVNF